MAEARSVLVGPQQCERDDLQGAKSPFALVCI